MLAPALEPGTVLPGRPDDLRHPAVTAGQQSLDDRRPAVVVAEADRLAVGAVGAQQAAERAEPGIDRLVIALRGPLEGGVRLGHEAADGHRAADVTAPAGRAARLDDPLRD